MCCEEYSFGPGRPVQASVCVERAAGFVALNAGVDHGDDVLENLSGDVDRPPSKPDTRPFEVNVTGAFYGIKLAAHYMTVPSTHAGTPKSGGKIIITASGGGIFPIPILAQHTASKHPLIGLVKLGPDQLTPTSTVIRCFDTLVNFARVDAVDYNNDDWVTRGKEGETVEANGEEFIWHHPLQPQEGKFSREAGVLVAAQAYKQKSAEGVAM
ncbi:hypothetical protein CLAIMM_11759 [Cladophialophora immunda]|nr:hypothetical protein CLAIMM_11759 [Cladophialophora immunda]